MRRKNSRVNYDLQNFGFSVEQSAYSWVVSANTTNTF